jgi:hypothetical protein
MRQKLWRATAFAFAFAAWPAQAQQGETVIHVVYHNFYDVVRPVVWAGSVDQEMTVVLSGKNNVREDFSASAAGHSNTWNSNATLGGARWRVLDSHHLLRTMSLRQSTRIDTIEIDGEQCRASWKAELKPGFSEYQGWMLTRKQMGFYREERMVSSTCDIHAR